jgi:hypothetical protein
VRYAEHIAPLRAAFWEGLSRRAVSGPVSAPA